LPFACPYSIEQPFFSFENFHDYQIQVALPSLNQCLQPVAIGSEDLKVLRVNAGPVSADMIDLVALL
jgi:hypothetical protein